MNSNNENYEIAKQTNQNERKSHSKSNEYAETAVKVYVCEFVDRVFFGFVYILL